MGEVLKAAFGCVRTPALTPRELNILRNIALLADDVTAPVLTPTGTVRQGRIGYVEDVAGNERSAAGAMHADMTRTYLPVFYATGWLREVDDPERDGAHQLNVAKLARLLDAAEAGPGLEGPAEADLDRPGDFEAIPTAVPQDLSEQVDRLLIRQM